MSLSLYDLFVSMGPFAKFIVVVLFLMSLISWTSSFQKLWQLWRSQKETQKFAPEFSRFLQEEQLDGAIKLAERQKRSHVARVVGEALSEVKPLLRDRATITAADINSVERAVEREILIVAAELKRGLGILATTRSTAPFVGLLLVVLIIFTIVTPIIAKGFQATIPRSENPENRPEGPDEIRLGIDKDGKFFLALGSGPKLIADAELPDRLASIYASRTQ